MVSQERKSHCDCETMFGVVSNKILKTFVPGDRSFNKFTYVGNAPVSSPLSIWDADFTSSDRCKQGWGMCLWANLQTANWRPSWSLVLHFFSVTKQISTLVVTWTNSICALGLRLMSIRIAHLVWRKWLLGT